MNKKLFTIGNEQNDPQIAVRLDPAFAIRLGSFILNTDCANRAMLAFAHHLLGEGFSSEQKDAA